jgi:putative ABC transport system permease protein
MLRYAVRSLISRPLFSIVATLTLALGLGANTAVFSVVNGVLLRPLPYRDPQRLAAIWPGRFISNAELLYLQEHARSFESVAAFSPGWGLAMTGAGEPAQLMGAKTSANFFRTLGVPPLLGRTFADGEAAPGSDGVMVLSYALWSSQFASDRSIVGRSVSIDGAPVTIIGVMPAGFAPFVHDADAWLPLTVDPTSRFHRGATAFAVGRLRPAGTLSGATTELQSLGDVMRRLFDYPDDYARGATVVGLQESIVGNVRATLFVLLGAVGFIVLIAGANVGNLLLVRGAARQREIAVRLALGAGRARIIAQLLTESLLLAAAGGLAGTAIGIGGVRALRTMLPADLPRLAEVGIDGRVLLVCAVVSLGIGIAFGIVPALIAGDADPQSTLRATTSGSGGSRSGRRLRNGLVVAEVALALVLVTGAGLMVQTLWRLGRVDPGFDPRHVLTLRLQPTTRPNTSPEEMRNYFRTVIDRVAAIPGVVAVGSAQHLPLSGFNWRGDVELEDRPLPAGATKPRVVWRSVEGQYFQAMGVKLLRGRTFTDGDIRGGLEVTVVNHAFAERFWPGQDPIGRRFKAGNATRNRWVTIVGVVGDVHFAGLEADVDIEMYRPETQSTQAAMFIVARTSADPLALLPAMRAAIRGIDAGIPIAQVRALEQLVRGSLDRPRVIMTLLLAFACVGLALGAIGIYGVVAYAVSQRTREIGVRMALGATEQRVLRLVLSDGARLAALGVVIGLALAVVATRALRGLVYGVSTLDPVTYLAVAALLVTVAIVATLVPARRAARIPPATALRME